jgi:hypothetical protein
MAETVDALQSQTNCFTNLLLQWGIALIQPNNKCVSSRIIEKHQDISQLDFEKTDDQ